MSKSASGSKVNRFSTNGGLSRTPRLYTKVLSRLSMARLVECDLSCNRELQSRAFAALEVDADSPIYVGETNIENAFHRFGVPHWLMLTWTAAHQGLGVTPAGDSGLVGPLGCSSCKTSEWSHSVGLRRPSLALLAWSGLTWRTGWSTSIFLLAWEPLQVSAPRTRPAVRLGSVGISWSRHARDKLLQVRCYSVLGICRRLSLNCPQPSCSLEASPRPRAGDV